MLVVFIIKKVRNAWIFKFNQVTYCAVHSMFSLINNFENYINFFCFDQRLKTHSLRAVNFVNLRFQ